MKHYKIIAHIADIRLLAEGTTHAELFNAALEGMSHIITTQHGKPPYASHHSFNITSTDTTTLLIDFLSYVLTQTHLTKTVFWTADFKELTATSLQTTIHGNKATMFEEDIKAVTYHEANVVINEHGNYQTMIVFDI